MDNVIYLEADEEITSVVEKMKRTKSPVIGIVAPRNAVLLQSVVNLKLLKRQAAGLKKEIALVTSDRIGQNLALRTGLTVYANVHDTEPLAPLKDEKPENIVEDNLKASSGQGFKVHRYDEDAVLDANEDAENEEELPAKAFSSRAVGTAKKMAEPETSNFQAEGPLEDSGNDESIGSDQDGKEMNKEIVDREKPIDNHEENEEKSHKKEETKSKHDVVDTKAFSPLKKTKTNINKLKIILVGIIFIAIVAAIGYGALNSTAQGSLKITVASEPVSQDLTLQVSKDRTNNDNIKNIIPGRLIESEQTSSQKLDATGKKDVGEKASGKMTVSNGGVVGQSFEANTAFKSSSGLIFRSNKAFTVPAATAALDKNGNPYKIEGTVTVDVTADKPGEDYNIDAGNYTLTGYNFVTGKGTAMAGGLTKEITVVSKADIDKATTTMTTDLTTKTLDDLKKKAGNAIYLDKAVKTIVVDASSDTEADTQANDFTMTIKIKSNVLVFDRSKLDELIQENLRSKIPADKKLLTADTEDLNLTVTASDPDAGTMKLSARAKGKIVPNLDKESIQSEIAGKTPDQIRTYFSTKEGVRDISITLTPQWWLKKMPTAKSKISVVIATQ